MKFLRSAQIIYVPPVHTFCNRILGLISKSFECKNPEAIVRLYTILVRPIIEYNNVLWGPTNILDNQRVERS